MDDFEDGFYGFRFSNDHTEILMLPTQEPGTGVTIFRGSEQNLMIIWTHSNGNRYAKFVAYKGNVNENYNDLVLYKIGNTGGKSYKVYLTEDQKTTVITDQSTNNEIPTAASVYTALSNLTASVKILDDTNLQDTNKIYLDDLDDGLYGFNFGFSGYGNVTVKFNSNANPSHNIDTSSTYGVLEQNLMILWTVGNYRIAKFFGADTGNGTTNTDGINDVVLTKNGNTYNAFKKIYITNTWMTNHTTPAVNAQSDDLHIPTAKAVYDAIQAAIYVDPNEVIT